MRFWKAATLLLSFVFATGAGAFVRYSLPAYRNLNESVVRLNAEVAHLRQEQSTPATLLARYRNSICYVYASYVLERPRGMKGHKQLHLHTSGTGFVVANGVLATNRHVLESGFEDPEAVRFVSAGAIPKVEQLVAFFPGVPHPVTLHNVRLSPTEDLAIARFVSPNKTSGINPLPLANTVPSSGEAVVLVGYPMGTAGMLAKSPQSVYERLAFDEETVTVASDLASMSLIRPSVTFGRLGDIVGNKLMYDAPTAHGGSGGPVFNAQGEVIAVNSAYIRGFPGGTLGISVSALKTLLDAD